jgi:zinc and cadmium transporter
MTQLTLILLSVLAVSLISLVGVFTLLVKERFMERVLFILIAGATGTLLGAAFLDLIPEAMNESGSNAMTHVLFGLLSFFILERFIFWRHCHEEKCEIHAFTYLNLIGDAIHNFLDGMVIAAAYLSSGSDISLGLITTIAIISHEIPQEIGDFGILVYGGLSKYRALLFNFLSALTSFIGAILFYFFSPLFEGSTSLLLGFAAGGFIYIAAVDLLPELNKELEIRRSAIQLAFLTAGIFAIWFTIRIFE